MPELDLILAPALAPDDLIGLELHFLDAIAARQTAPVLLIYASPGRCISIGRYHLFGAAPAHSENGISVIRRLTGGRVAGAGQGWLGLALIAPTRTALLMEDAAPVKKLKPEQIMNRYARGILTGLRALGIDCFYPGRDAITFKQREIAMCTFETDAAGAMLFEAAIAHNRGMEELVHDLERIDPDGALSCRMYDAASATKVVRELARDVSFDELAGAIASGYRSSLGQTRRRELTAIESAQAQHRGDALANSNSMHRPVAGASPTLRNRIASQLGAIEAAVALKADRTIEAVRLSGDFIANSPAIAQLESELRGHPLDLASVSHAVAKTFGDNETDNFFLGAGELSNLVRLIAGVN
ncbi:lipoyl protein ligase domain-containing protein [Candidatus Binatus sp.]|uniref:lipoyl protein ligase domain-containing protein n=1 Tax=Candidatus Binatus sp. TaxID=2811406 RepID=UPI002F92C5E6